MSATSITLSFEPSDTNFFDSPDGNLYANHGGQPVAKNDGQFIATQAIRNSFISIYLKEVRHSTFGDSPASLLVFEFTFLTENPQYRIKQAFIDIEFNYTATSPPPHIQSYCPRHIVGDNVKRIISKAGDIGIATSAGLPAIKTQVDFTWGEVTERPSRFTLLSKITKSYSDGHVVNGIRWVLNENANSKEGIPYLIPIALLIKRKDMNFCANINIEAKIPSSMNPIHWFGMFASIRKPITIDITTATTSLEGSLDDVDLEELVDLPDYT